MNKKRSADADKLLERLAVSSPNDAVKLLYLSAQRIYPSLRDSTFRC